jgi:hypothetical protein
MPAQPKASKRALADALRRLGGGLQRLARVELAGLLGEDLAHRAGHRQADVGVDVDLAHAAGDAALDLFHRHAVGLLDVAAVLADDGQPLLRHAGRLPCITRCVLGTAAWMAAMRSMARMSPVGGRVNL